MKILIADRSVQIIDRLEGMVVDNCGSQKIYRAMNFHEALKFFSELKPEVVLLDMNFPGNQSFDLLKLMKETNNKTCVVALSIYAGDNIRKQCIQLGTDHFLDKYNEFEKITGIISAMASK
jgi:DNA-binding NarL/FixJ family response regulator